MITGKVRDIQLKGLTSALSDYDCADGELQVCHNLLNDGAGLRPVEAAEAVDYIAEGHELIYIHHTASGSNSITAYGDKRALNWFRDVGTQEAMLTDSGEAVYWNPDGGVMSSVGNILIYRENDNVTRYFLWKGTAEGYAYLGQKIPELKLDFGLTLSKLYSAGSDIKLRSHKVPSLSTGYDNSTQTIYGGVSKMAKDKQYDFVEATFDAVLGTVNTIVAAAKDGNRFCFPFFVRYAYEMYDGSVTMQSTPLLMLPCTTVNPVVACVTPAPGDVTTDRSGYTYTITVGDYRCELITAALTVRLAEKFSIGAWSDLIKKVNVYVSEQIYPYDPDGEYMSLENMWRAYQSWCIGSVDSVWGGAFAGATRRNGDSMFTYNLFSGTGSSKGVAFLYLPELTGTSLSEKIQDTYNYYLFKSYDISEVEKLSTEGFTEIDAHTGILKSIETQEQLKDDYHSHDTITAKVYNTYNSRLNKADCRLIPFNGMPGEWLSAYNVRESEESSASYTFTADVYIKENGVVLKVSTGEVSRGLMSGWFFYPNPNAYVMILRRSDGKKARLPLKTHPFLYGAYYFTGFGDIEWSDSVTEEAVTEGETAFCYPNYMYTSEVDNPFVFPSTGLNAVGTGEIVAVKTATKAMSQGTAFGTNPLYAFCTDGVWALEVGGTGLFTAKQPVSRETLLGGSALSATQIDNSILFLSDRGLMELAGGQTRLLSGALQGLRSMFDVTDLPHWTDIMEKFGGQAYLEADDFTEYMDGARIAFDYVNYRAVVFRPYTEGDESSGVAFVYDLAGRMWGTAENRMTSVVEDNGATYVNYDGGGTRHVGVFVKGGGTLAGDGKGFYTTRPLKLDAPDVLKTVRTIAERSFTEETGYMAVWGSRDMRRWSLIGAAEGRVMRGLSGTPFKYIVAAGWSRLSVNGDVISRLTMDVKEKYTDRIR